MTDTCVCCGTEIPEGRMVCPICEANGGVKTDDRRLPCDLEQP